MNTLKPLPISEEMLGAYIEGNLHGSELREVQNIIEKDPVIAEIISNTTDTILLFDDYTNMWGGGIDDNYVNDSDFQILSNQDFELPEINLEMPVDLDGNYNQEDVITQMQMSNDDILQNSIEEINPDNDSALDFNGQY